MLSSFETGAETLPCAVKLSGAFAGGETTTQYFSGSSLYRLTPTTEKIARAIAAEDSPSPIHIWELPRQLTAGVVDADEYERE